MKKGMHHVSDDDLLARTVELVRRSRRMDAELVAHMSEVDDRRLYLREACPSMFVYATTRLGLSEAEAYLRITAGRVAKRLPVVLERLAAGRIQLSAIARLAPHLTEESAERLLARAEGRSKREVEMLVAELAPRPDSPALIRRVPEPAAELVPGRVAPPESAAPESAPVSAVSAAAQVTPLAPGRFKVQFTASAELEAKIARARALLRHKIPSGDMAAIFDEAMTVLLAKLEKTRCAATDRPRSAVSAVSTSRHVPAAVRRAVWQRDDGRCAFVDRQGRRCEASEFLEIHHVDPFGQGGETRLENLRLLCRAHNQYQAELDYGVAFMAERRGARSRASERRAPYARSSGHAARGYCTNVMERVGRAVVVADSLDAKSTPWVRASMGTRTRPVLLAGSSIQRWTRSRGRGTG